ncbi:uncharacterized protein LOC134468752, partial [Engraulis encrasicolus]|uniref:uncharacterized protein LOC134468752 n=1 Tax=Engraulis encrasicolus TaxID=184585 RepID=UPI002FD60388
MASSRRNRYCAFPGCSGQVGQHCSLHRVPTESNVREQWLLFIFNNIPTTNRELYLCSAHFTDDCFLNLGQFRAGYSQNLMLIRGSVPTLRPNQPHQPVSITLFIFYICFAPYSSSDDTTVTQTFSSTPVKCPPKRPRLELEEDMEELPSVDPDPADIIYDPAAHSISTASVSQVFTPPSAHEDSKYIVCEQALFSLFENCPRCECVCKFQDNRRGTFI